MAEILSSIFFHFAKVRMSQSIEQNRLIIQFNITRKIYIQDIKPLKMLTIQGQYQLSIGEDGFPKNMSIFDMFDFYSVYITGVQIYETRPKTLRIYCENLFYEYILDLSLFNMVSFFLKDKKIISSEFNWAKKT